MNSAGGEDLLRVLHVITGLNVGGAETVLYRLLTHSDRAAFKHQVVSLTDCGPMTAKIAALGMPVESLGMKPGLAAIRALIGLRRRIRTHRVQIVQTWMYHGDLLGGVAARYPRRVPVLWNVRNSTLDATTSKRVTIMVARLCARLSRRVPSRIVCCSRVAMRVHLALGYAADKFVVIANGFDLEEFKPDPAARRAVRAELGLAAEAILIGMSARYDPQKDHAGFVAAAQALSAGNPGVGFVLWGDGVNPDNQQLSDAIARAGLETQFHLLGRREDIARLTATLDIATLSSAYGEAFPNVVGEAMACGVPCVGTDVGDTSFIIGETGRIIAARNPTALARAWAEMISLGSAGRSTLGAAARRRVETNFSMAAMVAQYEALYREHALRCVAE